MFLVLLMIVGVRACPNVFAEVPVGCVRAVNACTDEQRRDAIMAVLPTTRSLCPWNRPRSPHMTWCDLVRIECIDGSMPFADVPAGFYVSAVFIMLSLMLMLGVKRAYKL
jgi:hypothetical protein